MCALVSWARTRRVQRIILAENSNTQFDFSRIVRHLEAAGKRLNCWSSMATGSHHASGKGFGEGEILEYVYTHSRLLRLTDTFYKVTGGLFVRNFDLASEATASRHAFRRKISIEREGVWAV